MMPDTITYFIPAIILTALNILAFSIFGLDKLFAVRRWRRISESTLLMWSLFGGSIGAKLAQRAFRHKTVKQPFARRLNFILAFHMLIVAGLLYRATLA